MRGTHGREGLPRVIFAIEDQAERAAFTALMAVAFPGSELFFPTNIAEVEAIYSKDRADAIVTDFHFHAGALADWLTFWPLPAVLVVDPEEDLDRIEKTVRDEAALFAQRLPDLAHIRVLPLLIRKALNLRESTARQNAYLQMSERQYMNLLQAVPDVVYILDGQGRFIYLNDAVRNLGYEPSGLIGRHFSEIIHPEDLPRVSRAEVLLGLRGQRTGDKDAPKLFNERRSGPRMTRNLELRLRLGSLNGNYLIGSINSYGEVSCSGYALPEFEGQELGTVGLIRDITLRKEYELGLETALASKVTLLREIHHRIKNNLQVVSSLLNIQESAIEDSLARKVFVECQTQIQTMAMVHETLYGASSLDSLEMQAYFERLLDYLTSVYEADFRGISTSVKAGGLSLGLDEAMPLALVVNELVSNCMRHAFPGGSGGRIVVSLGATKAGFLLEVEDDGVGLGQGADSSEEPESAAGIGTELVQALVAQLRGAISRSAGRGGSGTLVAIVFRPRASAGHGQSKRD